MLCLQEEPFVLPAEVQARMEAYAARFYILKTPRKLVSGRVLSWSFLPHCCRQLCAQLCKVPDDDRQGLD